MATLSLGIDVGSTTVKYVLCDAEFEILAKEYRAHDTKQADTLLKMLQELSKSHPEEFKHIQNVYITGSGASRLAPTLNATFIQEVNAVVIAIEHMHPDVRSIVELGGQDAKIIHIKESEDGQRSIQTSMNDKCASGTGATIEKCSMKVGLEVDEIQKVEFDSSKLHNVAAKCGVFAETDIVNLLKSSVPSNEIINSLGDAIVMQNLTVLTRGNTLMPKVLLLGGPNTYLPFLQKAWRERITQLWDERGIEYDKDRVDELISVPQNAQYYAALGAVIFGKQSDTHTKAFDGLSELEALVNNKDIELSENDDLPLVSSQKELEEFRADYKIPQFAPVRLNKPTPCYLGIDGGSTSSKAVLVDQNGELLLKVYQLSKGNPIEDIIALLKQIKESDSYDFYDIRGLGVTGYAADVLEGAIGADVNIVETIAHMKSAQSSFGKSVNVICDVGGQDIKVLFLENGMMKNFRLSNQCSAGNGALLQSMAKQFGVELEDFADVAFGAKRAPRFNYGCAVFLDTDRVNFQKEGYSKEELFAGIAKVLPKNIWQYVVQAPNLSMFGRHFVLQGGTQYNQAALKAQVDYIKQRVSDATVDIHPHPGEAGAIGAALEARDSLDGAKSSFIGIEQAIKMSYTTTTSEETRCHFCPMECSRTFIDTTTPDGNSYRYIAGFSCESGTVESPQALQELKAKRRELQKKIPNLVQIESKQLFRSPNTKYKIPTDSIITEQKVITTLKGWGPTFRKQIQRAFDASPQEAQAKRASIKIAIPQVLNIYSIAPFLRAYLEALGLDEQNIIFSGYSNEEMYLEGAKYGSVDSCYPAKVAQSHIYALLHNKKFQRKDIDYIWFPAITHIPSYLQNIMGTTACPIVTGTPRVVRSAFTKESDIFKKHSIEYIDDTIHMDNKELLKKQLYKIWGERLQITKDESNWAVDMGFEALADFDKQMQQKALDILTTAEKNSEIVVLLLGRPYHSDPGINHEVMDLFQDLGFATISMRSIPRDESYLYRFFKDDLEGGYIDSIFDITDVWPENFSTNSAQKVWAAKFAARHPNIAVVDLSSFKCGHDAPTYGIIDKILGASRTPHLTLHDIDANKPGGSINIRVKTFAYTLNQYKKELK